MSRDRDEVERKPETFATVFGSNAVVLAIRRHKTSNDTSK